MKSWNKNWNIPAFLIFNIVFFAVLFYFDLHKNINIGSFESIGTVSFKINSIQRKFDTAVVWQAIQSESQLRDKDTIKTYPEADAIIRLNDGTEIQVDENTMIYLDYSGKSPNINFEGGSIQINNSKGKNPGQELTVKTKNQTIKFAGSDAKIDSSGSGGNINVSLDKGTAVIEGKGESKSLKPNEIATIGESGVTTRLAPYALIEPENQKKFMTINPTLPISFTWGATGNNTNTTFELSRLKDFKKIETKIQTPNSAKLNLSNGAYYWRVSGKNSSGIVEYSESRKFIIIKESGLQLYSPSQGANFPASSGNPSISFAWTPSETVSEYLVELAGNSNFSPVLKTIPIKINTIRVNSLSEGSYFWRVTTKPSSDGILPIRSNVSSFTIGSPSEKPAKEAEKEPTKTPEEKIEEKKEITKKLEEKKQEEKKKIEEESIANLKPEHLSPSSGKIDLSKDKQIHFKWDKVKNASYYIFKIMEAKKKSKPLISEKTVQTSYTLKNFSKLNEGTFLWEVTPFDNKNKFGKTASGKFTIDLSDDGLKNLKPEEIKILSPDTIYRDK
jgi:hypothetical protein